MNERRFSLKGKCKRNESLRVNGGRPVARTPVGDKPRRIPRSQQCANRHHATRLLRRDTFPCIYPQFFRIYIYVYLSRATLSLYLLSRLAPPILSINFEKHRERSAKGENSRQLILRFSPRFFIPRSSRSINRIRLIIIRCSILVVSRRRLKCDHVNKRVICMRWKIKINRTS